MFVRIAVGVIVYLSVVAVADADQRPGVVVSGSVATAVDGESNHVSVAGSVGYRFNGVMALEVELTSMRLTPAVPANITSPYTSLTVTNAKSDGLFYTTNVRIDIPTTATRVLPFVVAGGGPFGLNTSYTETLRITPPVIVVPPGVVVPTPVPRVDVHHLSTTSTALGLTLGGGASFLIGAHLSVDADLRAFYVRGTPGGSIGRFGAGATYRF